MNLACTAGREAAAAWYGSVLYTYLTVLLCVCVCVQMLYPEGHDTFPVDLLPN